VPQVELPVGPIAYRDTGGHGPVLVLLHGVLMDAGQWRDVVAEIGDEVRCVLPTLPLGAHRLPARDGADLSLRGHARTIAAFLEALDLRDVTLVFNDWAAPQMLVADKLDDRIGGMVLVACETAGNYPPGLPGRTLALLGAVPGGLALALSALRIRALRRLPMTFGWMAKRGIPDDLFDGWIAAARDPRIRGDALRYIRSTRQGRKDLIAATQQLGSFERPVTVVWATEDKVMPMAEGRALADAFPNSRLKTVEDAYVLIPLDQPAELARLLREHLAWQHGADPIAGRDDRG
jgi:pimeloyl-ACP methyl ester carboxylesterase